MNMKCKSVVAVLMLALAVTDGMVSDFEDDSSEKREHNVREILFRSENGMNETVDADNVTVGRSEPNNATTDVKVSDDNENPPIRFGHWTILGCHNNDESWGCELRRMLHAASYGFVDTLK